MIAAALNLYACVDWSLLHRRRHGMPPRCPPLRRYPPVCCDAPRPLVHAHAAPSAVHLYPRPVSWWLLSVSALPVCGLFLQVLCIVLLAPTAAICAPLWSVRALLSPSSPRPRYRASLPPVSTVQSLSSAVCACCCGLLFSACSALVSVHCVEQPRQKTQRSPFAAESSSAPREPLRFPFSRRPP